MDERDDTQRLFGAAIRARQQATADATRAIRRELDAGQIEQAQHYAGGYGAQQFDTGTDKPMPSSISDGARWLASNNERLVVLAKRLEDKLEPVLKARPPQPPMPNQSQPAGGAAASSCQVGATLSVLAMAQEAELNRLEMLLGDIDL